jgi:transcriptional regulator with XRE-family HTH domain
MSDEHSSTPGREQLGSNLRRILAEREVSQAELARQLGVNRDTVVKYLRGDIDMPVSRLRHIANVLDAQPCHLLNGEPDAA